jgi:uroporphyrinogen decarboxylase
LDQYLGGNTGGPVPAAFFLHFGEAYRLGSAAIQRHMEFFKSTGMDFVKIQFELGFPRLDVSSAADFDRIPALPVDYYAPQLEVVKGLVDAMKDEALVVLTLYSPFMIAGQMAGNQTVIDYLESEPDAVFNGMEAITGSLIGFVRECGRLGLDGFYHSTQGAEAKRFKNRETFLKWVKPTDHRLMNVIDEAFAFNILHICDYHEEYGGYDDLTPFLDYPGHVVNVSTTIGGQPMSPEELSRLFNRPYMGGLSRLGPLSSGTEDEARAAAQEVLRNAPPKFILGADCTVPGHTRWENLRAAIEASHG